MRCNLQLAPCRIGRFAHHDAATRHENHSKEMRALRGHYWTLRPFFAAHLNPPRPPASRLYRGEVEVARNAHSRKIPMTGRLSGDPSARTLLVLVHGLGGSAISTYMQRAAEVLERDDLLILRLNMRGADRSGVGVYHAGLYDEIIAAIGDPLFSRIERVFLFGYSMGGHTAMRLAALDPPTKLRGVMSICSPVDLAAGCRAIDAPSRNLYRLHVLKGLKEIYAATAERRDELPAPLEEVLRIERIRDWDELVITREFGFESPEDYWESVGVGPHLPSIEIPALSVLTRNDPMVLEGTLMPHLSRAPNIRTICLDEGGHVGFPAPLDLGLDDARPVAQGTEGKGSLEEQALDWFLSRA